MIVREAKKKKKNRKNSKSFKNEHEKKVLSFQCERENDYVISSKLLVSLKCANLRGQFQVHVSRTHLQIEKKGRNRIVQARLCISSSHSQKRNKN